MVAYRKGWQAEIPDVGTVVAHYKRGTRIKDFRLRFFCSKNLKGGTMEQPKISVIFDGEIDVSALDEVFFTTLLNRITEMHREKQNTQPQENKND